jgi:hypothetical protein
MPCRLITWQADLFRTLGHILHSSVCLAIFGIHSSAGEFPKKRSSQDFTLFDEWQVSCIAIMFGLMGTGLRLRKSSLVINHQSPVDFITDASISESKNLRYTIVFLQVIPSLILSGSTCYCHQGE